MKDTPIVSRQIPPDGFVARLPPRVEGLRSLEDDGFL